MYKRQPEKFPGVAHFHTMRVAQPAAKYYHTKFLRDLCDIWDLRGSGMTNMHGSTGDIVLLGTQTPQLEEIFHDLTHKLHNDLGGSGSNLRTPEACLGQSRCEYACYNTQDMCYQLTQDYQDELHRPAFPYKFKFKFDGCPNGCVCAMARSDFAVVGTWKDDIKIDQDAVKAYVGGPDYRYFQYDMAGVGRRQVGSTIKPFLYTLAMENGMSPCDLAPNVQQTYIVAGKPWTCLLYTSPSPRD